MWQSVLLWVVWAGMVAAQRPYEAALTNSPQPVWDKIPTPTPAVPEIGTIVIPSASEPPPPPRRPTQSSRPVPITPPSVREILDRGLVPPPPPLPEPVVVAVTNRTPSSPETKTPSGGKFLAVAPNGSDENDGSPAKPWRTIQQAAAGAQPGDVVTVRAGIYEAFHTVRSGTADQPITFRADGIVIIGPARGVAPPGLKPATVRDLHQVDNIHIRETDYIIVEGFQVQRAGRAGISVTESRGVIVRNNVIGPSGRWGIFTGFAPEVQIISNKTFGAGLEHGIYVSNSRVAPDNVVIAYNESYDNNANGIQVNGDCNAGGDGTITGVLLEGNRVYGNGFKGLSLISMSDSVVQNNVIYDNGTRAGAGGIHLTDEIGCGKGSSGNVIVNNTVVEPRIACVRITDGATKNILFNNLLVGGRPYIDEVGGNRLDADSNVRETEPLGIFLNPAAGDYRPLVTSPARRQGIAEFAGHKAPELDRDGRRRPPGSWNAGAY
jgi:parallel beta-helix repeat protein